MVQSAFLEQRRTASPTAIAVVVAVHAGLIAAVALWKIEVITHHDKPIVVTDVRPIPEPKPLPRPPEQHKQRTERITTIIDTVVKTPDRPDEPPVVDDPIMTADSGDGPATVIADPPPPPPPPQIEQSAHAKGDVRKLFHEDDYPMLARERQEMGSVRARLSIGPDGHVAACNVVASSGSSLLDNATCRVLKARARFTPARDSSGQPIGDSYETPQIVWRLEG